MLRLVSRSISLAALALTASAAIVQGQAFEGVVHATIASPRGSQDVAYSIKGDRMRMDIAAMNGMEMAMIVDRPAHRMLMLMPSRQMYMERPIDTTAAARLQGEPGTTIRWTGKHETIAGYDCEHAVATGRTGEQVDMCIAKGLGSFFAQQGMRPGRGAGAEWQRLVQGGFPLKVQQVGDSTAVFTVTKVERKPIDDAQFSAPSGWMKMEMPGMP